MHRQPIKGPACLRGRAQAGDLHGKSYSGLPSRAAALAHEGENGQDPEIERIDDPWFAGLHTVFAVDATRCLVSASGPDAVLLLDLEPTPRHPALARARAERYGRNYELTDQMFGPRPPLH